MSQSYTLLKTGLHPEAFALVEQYYASRPHNGAIHVIDTNGTYQGPKGVSVQAPKGQRLCFNHVDDQLCLQRRDEQGQVTGAMAIQPGRFLNYHGLRLHMKNPQTIASLSFVHS